MLTAAEVEGLLAGVLLALITLLDPREDARDVRAVLRLEELHSLLLFFCRLLGDDVGDDRTW